MTKDEALRLALEALKEITLEHGMTEKAITAIKAALEAKDEPVALAWAEGYRMGIADERTSEANIGIAGFNAKVEPARENPYVTTLPQRTWAGLTDEERGQVYVDWRFNGSNSSNLELCKVIEAKLKEKNT